MIEQSKKRFLDFTRVTTSDDAMRNSLTAALQRNLTYQNSANWISRKQFQGEFKRKIYFSAEQYRLGITEERHLETITAISDDLSHHFVCSLVDGRLRIGTVQKALNLYIKFMWCLEQNWNTPPHCPIDRIVLQSVNINEAWTKLDSIKLYSEWISVIRKEAEATKATSIAEWELNLWGVVRQQSN